LHLLKLEKSKVSKILANVAKARSIPSLTKEQTAKLDAII